MRISLVLLFLGTVWCKTQEPKSCVTHADCSWDEKCVSNSCAACTSFIRGDGHAEQDGDCCLETYRCKDSACKSITGGNSAGATCGNGDTWCQNTLCNFAMPEGPFSWSCTDVSGPQNSAVHCLRKAQCATGHPGCVGDGDWCLENGGSANPGSAGTFKICHFGDCMANNWGSWGSCYQNTNGVCVRSRECQDSGSSETQTELCDSNDCNGGAQSTAAISVLKSTLCSTEEDALPKGSEILSGTSVAWKYTVRSVCDVDVTEVTITDDMMPSVTIGGASFTLAARATVVETVSGTTIVGEYTNVANVTGTCETCTTQDVSATATSSYWGVNGTGIFIKKEVCSPSLANCEETSNVILPGKGLKWKYTVSSESRIGGDHFLVVDDNGTPSDTSDDFAVTYQSGDNAGDGAGFLESTEHWIYHSAASTAQDSGTYTNIATVSYKDDCGRTAEATAESSYTVALPAITITKVTNGADGLCIQEGARVTWTYTIHNTGNVPLTEVSVTDDHADVTPAYTGGTLPETLAVDETWTFTATGKASAVDYRNVGDVTAKYYDSFGNQAIVTASDPSNYTGVEVGQAACFAGQHYPSGEAFVFFDGTDIRVVFQTYRGWTMKSLHVFVGESINDAFQNNGNPAPGHFNHVDGLNFLTSYNISGDFHFWNISNVCTEGGRHKLYVAVHADVVGPNGNGETSWCTDLINGFSGSNWATFFTWELNCACDTACEVVPANEGTWGAWSNECSQPCGTGYRTRERNMESNICPPFVSYETCNQSPCGACLPGSPYSKDLYNTNPKGTVKVAWDGTFIKLSLNAVPTTVATVSFHVKTQVGGNVEHESDNSVKIVSGKGQLSLLGRDERYLPECLDGDTTTKATVKITAYPKNSAGNSLKTVNFDTITVNCWCGAYGLLGFDAESETQEDADVLEAPKNSAMWIGIGVGCAVAVVAVVALTAWYVLAHSAASNVAFDEPTDLYNNATVMNFPPPIPSINVSPLHGRMSPYSGYTPVPTAADNAAAASSPAVQHAEP